MNLHLDSFCRLCLFWNKRRALWLRRTTLWLWSLPILMLSTSVWSVSTSLARSRTRTTWMLSIRSSGTSEDSLRTLGEQYCCLKYSLLILGNIVQVMRNFFKMGFTVYGTSSWINVIFDSQHEPSEGDQGSDQSNQRSGETERGCFERGCWSQDSAQACWGSSG